VRSGLRTDLELLWAGPSVGIVAKLKRVVPKVPPPSRLRDLRGRNAAGKGLVGLQAPRAPRAAKLKERLKMAHGPLVLGPRKNPGTQRIQVPMPPGVHPRAAGDVHGAGDEGVANGSLTIRSRRQIRLRVALVAGVDHLRRRK
jgi:hypothetical protein